MNFCYFMGMFHFTRKETSAGQDEIDAVSGLMEICTTEVDILLRSQC
jgi:hypothetical protein